MVDGALTCHGFFCYSPVLAYAGIHLSRLRVHSPVTATMALTLHGLCWYPPVMAKGALICHSGQWHSPVIAYAGIHLSWYTLEFTCHG
jgi:hypothetical protein